MAEFTDLSEVLNRLSGGNSGNPETLWFQKAILRYSSGSSFTATAGKTYSAWLTDGGSPGCGVAPTTVAVPTSATRGAVPFTNASGGRQKRLITAAFGWAPSDGIGSDQYGDIIIYDRLLHIGNLSGTSASAQNVQSGSGVSLTRNTGGVGNEIWIEIYTAIGSTPQTVTCSYTNQAGTSGRTTQAMPIGGGSNEGVKVLLEIAKMQLQAGDTGVRSVETLTLSGSTGTAGAFGVTIVHRLADVPLHDGVGMSDFTYGLTGTPIIEDDACLAMLFRTTATSAPDITGFLATAER